MDAKLRMKWGDLELEFEGSEHWLTDELPGLLAQLRAPVVVENPQPEQSPNTPDEKPESKSDDDAVLGDLSPEEPRKDPFKPQGMAYRAASNDPNASTIALRPELP